MQDIYRINWCRISSINSISSSNAFKPHDLNPKFPDSQDELLMKKNPQGTLEFDLK